MEEQTQWPRLLVKLQAQMRACHRCLDEGHEITPGAIFTGRATADVMIIGQAPGVTEVEAKRPFNAGSGRRLFQWLNAAGWEEDEFRRQKYMTAVTKCYPGKSSSGRGDRVPTKQEQAFCQPFLQQELALVNPKLIIPVGTLAIRVFYPAKLQLRDVIGTMAYFPPKVKIDLANLEMSKVQLLRSPSTDLSQDGRLLVPLPHPSGASAWPNRPDNKALIDRAIALLRFIRSAWRL